MKASRTARTAVIHAPTSLQLESWRLLWEELVRDGAAAAEWRAWEERRRQHVPEVLELLGGFLDGAVDLETFRATFDERARTRWGEFGVRGLSGAMFLNRLVKHAPDAGVLASRLRAALRAPRSVADGRTRLDDFVTYLRELADQGGMGARLFQPARAAFFVTIWWHLQDVDRWPGYQLSARRALQLDEGLFTPGGDPTDDYFAFRESFLLLANALDRTSWELEYLCWWQQHRHDVEPDEDADVARRPAPVRVVRERVARPPGPRPPGRRPQPTGPGHTQLQWLLARIGRRLGCRVWIAANDHARAWQGAPLGALSIRRLPSLGLDPDAQRVISLIDVVWLKGANQVVAAFEVEYTSAVYSGLLRLADLAALSPNLNFPLYIVAPERRLAKVRRELLRPTFQALELPRRCTFFSGEALLEAAESIMRWGSGPAVMERLARSVEGSPGGVS